MSMRDYFAGLALHASIMAGQMSSSALTSQAYTLADLMLQARTNPQRH